jgi:8-oxo-dGTP pyrophosphatase MutT (NUDIX family)
MPGEFARECVEAYLFARPPLVLLLFQRPPSRGSIWVPISGKVDPTDADFEAAVRRELAEETGLRTPHRLFALDWHVPFTADNGERWRLHAYGVEVERGFQPVLSDEHVASEWLGLDEARGRLHYPDNRAALDRLLDRMEGPPAPTGRTAAGPASPDARGGPKP